MKPSIQARIVKISVPAFGTEDLHWHFTGYVLCSGLIITCRHGFAEGREFDEKRPIKVVCQGNKIDETIPFKGKYLADLLATSASEIDKPILYESEDFDVVLLACPDVEAEFSTIKYLSDSGGWTSGGFPRFVAEAEANGFELFAGTHLGSKNEGCYLSMTVVDPAVRDDADWSNASGSPIFDGNKLVGVLKEYRKAAQGSFVVGYLHRLWERNDEFKATIEKFIPTNDSYPQAEAKGFLEHTDNAELKEALRKLVPSVNSSEDLYQYLLGLDKTELMAVFQQLDREHAATSKPLLISLLSAAFEDVSIHTTDLVEQPYHTVSVASPAACEFLMAAYDKRQPEFVTDDLYTPKYSMTTVESGINSKLSENFAENLLNGRADVSSVAARINNDRRKIPNIDYERNGVQFAQGILAKQKESYYWPVPVKDKGTDEFLALTKTFPQLKILNQEIDPTEAGEEVVLIDDVSEFLKD